MQNPLKVVHYTACWLPQTMTWLYTHTRLPEDYENHVVCQWSENRDQFPVKHLISLERPPRPAGFFGKVRRRLGLGDDASATEALLDQAIVRLKPDVLHSHFGNCGWAGSRVAQKHGIRHVVSFYGLDLSYLPKEDPRWFARYREMSDRIDLVLCEGPHMARCIANLGVDARKIELFRLGIDLERFPFVPRRNTGSLRFLICGSFREKKGIPYALEALGLLSQSLPGMEITIIGASLGSKREEVEKGRILTVLEQYGLGPKTRFLGYIPYELTIREFYQHDIFLSPSVTSSDGDTEGGAPVTIIEAAASGMPVVSTFHCDIPFVLSEENRRYLAPERDSIALAQAVQRLIECKDWEPIVAANRKLVEEEMDVRRQRQRLAGIYTKLSGRRSLATPAGSRAN